MSNWFYECEAMVVAVYGPWGDDSGGLWTFNEAKCKSIGGKFEDK